MKKINFNEVIKEIIILTVAVAIIAAAVYFFLVPSHTSVSSISGLGIVLSNFVPLPLSAITMILNVVLLIIGFLTCGREFGVKTVYTSIMLPVFIGIFEKIFADYELLKKAKMDIPPVVEVGMRLEKQQIGLEGPVLQEQEMIEKIVKLYRSKCGGKKDAAR